MSMIQVSLLDFALLQFSSLPPAPDCKTNTQSNGCAEMKDKPEHPPQKNVYPARCIRIQRPFLVAKPCPEKKCRDGPQKINFPFVPVRKVHKFREHYLPLKGFSTEHINPFRALQSSSGLLSNRTHFRQACTNQRLSERLRYRSEQLACLWRRGYPCSCGR